MPPLAGSPAIDAGSSGLELWTFETSQPSTTGTDISGITPEFGPAAAMASGHHASSATYANPVGNGSMESFSVNTWAIGDYFQFSTSTSGLSDLTVSFDQASSGTGPREFKLEYSTDGSNFTFVSDYDVLQNGSPNFSWNSATAEPAYGFSFDLSSLTALNNQSTVHFRLSCRSTVSANGGIVAATGTSRVDNFALSGQATDHRGFARLVAESSPANGGPGSLNYISDLQLSLLTNDATTYTFSFLVSDIGLTPNAWTSIRILRTYISDSGYRSTEALPGTVSGTQGWNPFTSTSELFTRDDRPLVTSINNSGTGSLRALIASADPGDTIIFDRCLDGQTITLTTGQIFINKDPIIDATSLSMGITISGNSISRQFEVTSNNSLTLRSLTLDSGGADGDGGAVYVQANGSLDATDCTFSNNRSPFNGGAIGTIGGTVSLTQCAFSGNSANGAGGGIHSNGSVTISHSTIAHNSADNSDGGGIYKGGGLSISNAIIAHNSASIVSGPDIRNFGTITPTGANIIGDPSGSGLIDGVNGVIVANPLLAPLGDYGGPTQTMPPLPGSPAIDAAIAPYPASDQRGVTRFTGVAADIGSVEQFFLKAPALVDTDNDGIDDRLEGPGGPYPHLVVRLPAPDNTDLNLDSDGSTDAEEIANGTDLFDPNDYFRILSFTKATGFDPLTNPVFDIAISTFPGLSYQLERQQDLASPFDFLTGSAFTADAFSRTLEVELMHTKDFLRANRVPSP